MKTRTTPHRLSKFFTVLFCLATTATVCSAQNTELKTTKSMSTPKIVTPHQYVYVVYLNPADRECLPDYQERLDRVITTVQTWYRDEMERNGFGPMTFPLQRDKDGKLIIHVVKGPKAYKKGERISSSHKFELVKGPMLEKGIDITQEHLILVANNVFVTPKGDDLIVQGWSDYVGGGSYKSGTAWVNDLEWLDTRSLTKKTPILWDDGVRKNTTSQHVMTNIGGIAHEFGHSLGLPHNHETPEQKNEFGCMLMGGGNYTFLRERTGGGKKGTFLSAAHATALSSHPLFKRDATDIDVEPKIEWHDIKFANGDDVYTISGRVESNLPAYAVLAYNDSMAWPMDYDAECWADKVNEDGTFEVEIKHLSPGFYESRLRCYLANGSFRELKHHFNVDANLKIPADSLGRQTLFQLHARPAIEDKKPEQLLAAIDILKTEDDIYYQRAKVYYRNMTEPERLPELELASIPAETKEIPLTDVKWASAEVEAGHPHVNRYWGLTPMESADAIHDAGIFAYGNSRYVYELDGKWTKLVGSCGFQNLSGSEGFFIVKCDGKEVLRTDVTKDWHERPFEIDLTGVKTLELIADSNGFSWGDEAAWYSPVLKR